MLNDIGIKRELNIDYEYLLIPESDDIKTRYQTQTLPEICEIFQILSCILLKLKKTCSFKKFGMVFGGRIGMLPLNQLYLKIEFERAVSKRAQNFTLCSTSMQKNPTKMVTEYAKHDK